MHNYETAPTIISSKDLNYLSDIYNLNFNTYKLIKHFELLIVDKQLKIQLQKLKTMHLQHAKIILNILS